MWQMFFIIRRVKNIAIVVFAVLAGTIYPELGSNLQFLITPLVMFLVFTSLYDIDSNTINYRSYIRPSVIFIIASYFILPVVGIQVVDLFVSGGTKVGYAILLAVPTTTGSAIVWTRMSDGEVQFSTFASMLSLFLAPIFTPLLLSYLTFSSQSVPTASIITDLIIILSVGMVLYYVIPNGTISPKSINISTLAAIMSLIYITISSNDISYVSQKWFTQVILLSFLLLLLGIILIIFLNYVCNLNTDDLISLFYIISLKNLGISILISDNYLEPLVVPTIVLCYVFQQVTAAASSDILSLYNRNFDY